jgi:MinD superfamily P-loop ATPase
MPKRPIVRINEDLCTGCGLCVTPCAEGAIEIVDGKARVIHEELCDGAGFCLAVCPTGALTVEEREVPAFDRAAADARMAERGTQYIAQTCFMCKRTEERVPLLPTRFQGSSLWVCTQCLPRLIHG